MRALYRTNMGLADSTPIYGTFTYANSRFILMNSEEISPPGEVRSPLAENRWQGESRSGHISQGATRLVEKCSQRTPRCTPSSSCITPSSRKRRHGAEREECQRSHRAVRQLLEHLVRTTSHERLYYNVQTGDTTSPPSRTDPTESAVVPHLRAAPAQSSPERRKGRVPQLSRLSRRRRAGAGEHRETPVSAGSRSSSAFRLPGRRSTRPRRAM